MARSASANEEIQRQMRDWEDRLVAITAALAASPAVVLTWRDGRKELLLVTPDTNPEPGRPLRITTFMADGPYGHENVADMAEAAARIREKHWKAITPASEAEVMRWTSSPEFVVGAKRVAIIQAANTLRWRRRKQDDAYRQVGELEHRAWQLFETDPDAAVALMEAEVGKDAFEPNPPRIYRPQKVVATLQKDTRPEFEGGAYVRSPADVMYAMQDYIGSRATESFVVLFLNVRNGLIGYTELTEGSVSAVSVNPSGIFREALAAGAAGMLTIHNHPSGDATASAEDRLLWKRLKAVGELLGIPVLDNLIIGEQEFFSEAEDGITPLPLRLRQKREQEQRA